MDKRKLKFSKVMFNGAFIYNPVLTQAIGICTIVAVGATLKISLIFSLIVSALLVITELLSSLILKRLSRWLRVSTYMLIATLILFPVTLYMDKNYSELSAAMGIFLPLLAVNSIIVIRCESFAVNNTLRNSFFDAIASSVGFSAVAIIVGALREIIAYGTIMGKSIPHLPVLSGMALPFGGLLILGFLAAFHKWILIKKFPRHPSATFNFRTAFDTPSFKNEGIHVTNGSFSLRHDPKPVSEEDNSPEPEKFESKDNEKKEPAVKAAFDEEEYFKAFFTFDSDDDSEDSFDEFILSDTSEKAKNKEDDE